jgi:hypothetical protein
MKFDERGVQMSEPSNDVLSMLRVLDDG